MRDLREDFEEEVYTRNLSHILNISAMHPRTIAAVVYGYTTPALVFIAFITNTLVIMVMSHRHLRTPTNIVFTFIAVFELLTGLSTLPWFVYYYALKGIDIDQAQGLPEFWCKSHVYFATHLPTIFHTAAVWLTVLMAGQRYIYVCCNPYYAKKYVNKNILKYSIIGIIVIIIVAPVIEIPSIMLKSHFTVIGLVTKHQYCITVYNFLETKEQLDFVMSGIFTFRCAFVHVIPCILLLFFSVCLWRRVWKQKRKRSAINMPPRKNDLAQLGNTMALLLIITLFLIIELVIAVIFVIHVLSSWVPIMKIDYTAINVILIFRNLLIIISYPINFCFFVGMSSSFKCQLKQTLKLGQYEPDPDDNQNENSRHRFSVQLVDVNRLRRTSAQAAKKALLNGSAACETVQTVAQIHPSPKEEEAQV